MMKVLLAATLFAISGASTDWYYSGLIGSKPNRMVMFFDNISLQMFETEHRIRVKVVFERARGGAKAIDAVNEIDCSGKRYRTLVSTTLAPDGSVMTSSETPEAWDKPVPSGFGSRFIRVACRGPDQSDTRLPNNDPEETARTIFGGIN